jgi:hypothetical protein
MTAEGPRDTIQELSNRTRGVPMAGIDLNAQFDRISDQAKTASDKLKAANQSARDRLETDANSARDRAAAAADRLNDKAVAAKEKASSQWQEMHENWHAHVAKVRANARKRQDHIDAHLSAADADMAEDYAVDAMYSRANAIALGASAR